MADARLRRALGLVPAVLLVVAAAVVGARLGRRARPPRRGRVHVRRSITVDRTAEDAYAFCRRLENLPRFMAHLDSVTENGEGTSRWRTKRGIEWDAELVEDSAGALIAWRSVAGAPLPNSGAVAFAPHGRATEVTVELVFVPPRAATVAELLGTEPRADLRRLKRLVEASR
jgi:uncharacterized membrane protein